MAKKDKLLDPEITLEQAVVKIEKLQVDLKSEKALREKWETACNELKKSLNEKDANSVIRKFYRGAAKQLDNIAEQLMITPIDFAKGGEEIETILDVMKQGKAMVELLRGLDKEIAPEEKKDEDLSPEAMIKRIEPIGEGF